MVFDYPGKSGQRRIQEVVDAEVAAIVAALKRRRGGGPELLAYKEAGRWRDLRSPDINAYLKEATGDDFSAKDFRTWSATVLAAVALAVSGPAAGTQTSRKRAISRAVQEVARYLGNTPAVARASYIDPRVFDRYRGGVTIGGALEALADRDSDGRPPIQGAVRPGELPIHHRAVEEAVLDLIDEQASAPGVERVAA
jgi:DNA topoisomerase IB